MGGDGLPYPREEKVERQPLIWPKPDMKMVLAFLPVESAEFFFERNFACSLSESEAGYPGCSRNQLLKSLPVVSVVMPCTPEV